MERASDLKSRSLAGSEPGVAAVALRLAHDYLRGQWLTLGAAMLAMIVTSAMTMGLAYIVQPAIRELFLNKNGHFLLLIPLLACAILIVRAASFYAQQTLVGSLGERIVAATQKDMFDNLIRRDLASLNEVHSGQFVSNFLYDATQMRDAITKGAAAIGLEIVQLVGLAALMVYQAWKLALLSLIVLPLVAWVMQRIGRSLRRAATRGMEETGNLSTTLAEALDGRRIIKAYGLEQHTSNRAQLRLQQRLRHLLKIVRTSAAAIPAADVFAGFIVALTLIYAGYLSVHRELEVDRFASFLAALLLAQQPVRNLGQLWTVASAGVAAATRIFRVMDTAPTIVDRPGAKQLVVPFAPRGGRIAFRDVSFAYGTGNLVPAVDRLNLTVAPGEKVAIVGPSGAGKSTLFNLLLRFYEPDAGRIEIDGKDIRDVTLKSLRNNFALVTQEPILFDETIADNIALGRTGALRVEVEAAAVAAAADGFVRDLPHGYDTRIGEGGLKLSGGQRQRIAIARAMLRNAPILLLDEATSSLDTESERQVHEALTRLMKDRTTIVIAHRLSTVQDADRIYVLDRGRIVESGPHKELIASGGLYSRLYQNNFETADGSEAAVEPVLQA